MTVTKAVQSEAQVHLPQALQGRARAQSPQTRTCQETREKVPQELSDAALADCRNASVNDAALPDIRRNCSDFIKKLSITYSNWRCAAALMSIQERVTKEIRQNRRRDCLQGCLTLTDVQQQVVQILGSRLCQLTLQSCKSVEEYNEKFSELKTDIELLNRNESFGNELAAEIYSNAYLIHHSTSQQDAANATRTTSPFTSASPMQSKTKGFTSAEQLAPDLNGHVDCMASKETGHGFKLCLDLLDENTKVKNMKCEEREQNHHNGKTAFTILFHTPECHEDQRVWIIDSAASSHITPYRDLINIKEIGQWRVSVTNGVYQHAIHAGSELPTTLPSINNLNGISVESQQRGCQDVPSQLPGRDPSQHPGESYDGPMGTLSAKRTREARYQIPSYKPENGNPHGLIPTA
ncbi:hypothetical protein BDK51DRAFT_43938 [Blyttiomyces helicus]|uniref:Uncharacterized protein n=1 Tax=Blyttiomyces helicus TaxID=388810 RepID=A0A4P9WMG4_9FUNG|nr:hypothetical protein BDK51DRAFT_43938 [Blyttiomyces helicus]|eukprot:RKO91916.1 hypothetical protein BDK51DRAFT_43938 [Blyttiomyces helicus]